MSEWSKDIPKAVLHDHLDGGLRVSTLIDLAKEQNYENLPTNDTKELKNWIQPKPDQSLALNLEAWQHTIGVMQDEDSLYRITMEALEDLAEDGVVYAELRFAPLVHCQKDLTPDEVVNAVLNGVKDGNQKYNILSGVLLCAMRQESKSLEVMDLCIKHKDVIGFDLAGPEIGFSVLNHFDAVKKGAEENINLTLHADWEVKEGIQEVAIDCSSKRVGHGSQIINDVQIENNSINFLNNAAKYVYEKRIPLELCPTSNIQCGAYPTIADHSFNKLYNSGFNVTINTDNRLMSNITMSQEVANLVNAFDLKKSDINKITKNTIAAGFVDSDKRESLLKSKL